MRIRLAITSDDIKHGVASDCGKCPIAIAMTRHLNEFPGAQFVLAQLDVLLFWGVRPGHRVEAQASRDTWSDDAQFIDIAEAQTPLACQRFMESFDMCEDVQPFTLEVEFKLLQEGKVSGADSRQQLALGS